MGKKMKTCRICRNYLPRDLQEKATICPKCYVKRIIKSGNGKKITKVLKKYRKYLNSDQEKMAEQVGLI